MGKIKGLVDIETGIEIDDADDRYGKIGFTPITTTPYDLSYEELRNKLVIGDTDLAGGDQIINLPELDAQHDGVQFIVQRDGSNLLTLNTEAGYFIKSSGFIGLVTSIDFVDDGDSATFTYRHSTKTFHLI